MKEMIFYGKLRVINVFLNALGHTHKSKKTIVKFIVNQDSKLDNLDVKHVALSVQYAIMVHLNVLNALRIKFGDYNVHRSLQMD